MRSLSASDGSVLCSRSSVSAAPSFVSPLPRRSASRLSSFLSDQRIDLHLLLELLERPAQTHRAGCAPDSHHPCSRLTVELEDHAECDHLAVGRRQLSERPVQSGGEPRERVGLLADRFRRREGPLTPAPPLFRTEV